VSIQTPNEWVKLTKTLVRQVLPPASGQVFVRDSIIRGFALRVTANGAKSSIVERRSETEERAYVFPGEGPKGCLNEPRKPIAAVIEASGVAWTRPRCVRFAPRKLKLGQLLAWP